MESGASEDTSPESRDSLMASAPPFSTENPVQFSSVQSLSHVRLSVTPMDCSTPGFPVHHQLPELAQTHVHRIGDATQHLILCRHLLLLPSIFPSIRVFSSESALHIGWTKYWTVVNRYQWLHPRYWSGTGASPGGCGFEWIAALVVAVQSLSRV